MKINPLLSLLFAALVLTACGGESTSEGSNDSTTANSETDSESEIVVEALEFDPEAEYLDRMYATTTGPGAPSLALDGNGETAWEGPAGTGANEGIMLYFSEPQTVSQIQVKGPGGNNSAKKFLVYIDGSEVGTAQANQAFPLPTPREINSLYLRIVPLGPGELDMDNFSFDNGTYHTLTAYPSDGAAKISEIELLDIDGNPLKVRPLTLVPGSVQPSSVLEPAEAYNGDFLFDSRLEFGWAEGKDDLGIGETIKFKFDRAVRIEKIKVWNGYQRSDRHFEANARVKTLGFGTEGNMTAYELADRQAPIEVELAEVLQGDEFSLSIDAAYEGTKYKDLLLSELRFWDGRQWFGVASDGEKTRKTDLDKMVSGTVLDTYQLLDRSWTDRMTYEGGDDVFETTLLLRSNGSFVIYHLVTDPEGNYENETKEIADGNWTVESKDGENVRIKLFGNLRQIIGRTQVYTKKSTSRSSSRIYSEYININSEKFSGTKLVEELYFRMPSGL